MNRGSIRLVLEGVALGLVTAVSFKPPIEVWEEIVIAVLLVVIAVLDLAGRPNGNGK